MMRLLYSLKTCVITEMQHPTAFYLMAFLGGILWTFGPGPVSPSVIGLIGGLGILGAIATRLNPIGKMTGGLLLCLGLGLGLTRAVVQDTGPRLERPASHVVLTGRVRQASLNPDFQRIVLDEVRIRNQPTLHTLDRVRLKLPRAALAVSVGDRVRLTAFLRPPMKPIYPGAYDERRRLALQRIGAVGQSDQISDVIPAVPGPVAGIETLRQFIGQRLTTLLPDAVARVAIPLTIGDQSGVSPHLYQIFRSAGIIHVLSVSGFHLSLLILFVCMVVRTLWALVPALSERFSGKKAAVVAALTAATGYILISGMQVPALRSWIMVAVVLIGLLFNRNALSCRSLTIAAFALLMIDPSLILEIGFQLSFMAVLVLVTLYPMLRRLIFPNRQIGLLGRITGFIGGLLISDILITLATAPLVIYHFNQYPVFSFIGNFLTGTVLSFWIMPLLFIGLILMPFGWDAWAVRAAGTGLEYVIAVCEKIDSWPHALITLPTYTPTAVVLMSGGVMVLCLMRTYLRWAGLMLMICGLTIALLTPRPDVLIGDYGQTVAVRGEDGHLHLLIRGPSVYTARQWYLHDGDNPDSLPRPRGKHLPDMIRVRGRRVAFTRDSCYRADVCVIPGSTAHEPKAVSLTAFGTRAVYMQGHRPRVWPRPDFP